MNAAEFEQWLDHHATCYPSIRGFLAQEDGSKVAWAKVVCRCDLDYAKRVTDLMHAEDLATPNGFAKHPAFVMHEANRMKYEHEDRKPVRFTGGPDVFDCPDCEDTGTRMIVHPDVMAAARRREFGAAAAINVASAGCTCRRGEIFLRNWNANLKTRLARFNPETMIVYADFTEDEIRQQLSELAGGVITVPLAGGVGREWVQDIRNS